jgi:hypothetical protein
MTLSTKSSRKRGLLAAVVAVTMALTGLAVTAAPAFASGEDVCENIAGIQATILDGYANDGYGLCTTPNAVHVTPAAPTYTPGTCSVVGTVVVPVSTQYTWEASGTSAATIETATPLGDVVFDGPTVYDRAQFGPYDLSKLSGDACPAPPTHVTVTAPTYTPGTCSVVGTVVVPVSTQYTWAASGTSAATIETASAAGNVVLDGQKVFGPYDLSKLSGDACPAPPTCTVTAPSPLTASWVKQYVDVVWTTNTGHFTAALKANVNLCGSVTILVSGYAVPSTWDGNGFNPTATPQQLVGTTKQIVLTNDVRTGEATADIPTCGNAQADGYTPPEIVAVTSAGHGDQFIAGGLWHIGNCPPPAPITCTVTGAPGTESGDHPPVQTAEGVDYRSYHDGHATGVVIPINANAQGITSLSFTDTNVVGYGMFSRLIFNLSADGGPGYASFSVSPGNTIDQNAVAGVGSKNVLLGKTVAQVGIAYPHNKIVGWAFQTGSSYPGNGTASSDGATLTGTSGDCGNVNHVPTKPASDVSYTPNTTVDCTSNSQTTITTKTVKPQIWDASATPPGYVIDTNPKDWTVTTDTPGVTVALTNTQIATQCPDNVIIPQGPSYTESCTITGANTADAVTNGITYADKLVGNTVTTTATASAPFIIKDGAQTVWAHTFTGGAASKCATKTLAFTGSVGFAAWLGQNALAIFWSVLVIMLLAAAMIVWDVRRRRNA